MNKIKSIKNFFTSWKKWLLEIVLIILLITGVRLYQQRDMVSGHAIAISGEFTTEQALDWTAYQGRPLLLHFWATWCPVCRFEQDSIQSISKDYPVLSIASWSEDTINYMQQNGLDFPALDDVEGEWAKQYGVKAVPTTFIIGPEGNIEFIESGFSSEIGLRLRLWWLGL